MGEVDAGSPVAIVYPDRKPDEIGTLFIPNTLALIKGAPNVRRGSSPGRSPLEPRSRSRPGRGGRAPQIPLLKSTEVSARVETPKTVHAMEVEFEAAAKVWNRTAEFLASEFAGD